jgi:hypothetical protein
MSALDKPDLDKPNSKCQVHFNPTGNVLAKLEPSFLGSPRLQNNQICLKIREFVPHLRIRALVKSNPSEGVHLGSSYLVQTVLNFSRDADVLWSTRLLLQVLP